MYATTNTLELEILSDTSNCTALVSIHCSINLKIKIIKKKTDSPPLYPTPGTFEWNMNCSNLVI